MKDKQVLIRMSPEDHKKLAHSAIEAGVSRCEFIRVALQMYLEHLMKQKKT